MAVYPVTLPAATVSAGAWTGVQGQGAGAGTLTVAATTDTFSVTRKSKNITKGSNTAELWFTVTGDTPSGLVLLQMRPADDPKWYAFVPSTIGTSSNPSARSITNWAEDFLEAENAGNIIIKTPEATNTDDSYSLRDVTEYKTTVATVSITGDSDWVDENTLRLDTNSVFTFTPSTDWSASFTSDDDSLTVLPGETYTTMGRSGDDNLVEMTALQYVAQDGTFEVWRGDFKTASATDPIAYYGAFNQGQREVIEEFSNSAGSAQLVKMPDNAITKTEGEYLVFRSRGENNELGRIGFVDSGNPNEDGSFPFVPFTGLEQAKAFYDEYVEGLKSTVSFEEEQARLAAEEASEAARKGLSIGTEKRGKRIYSIKYMGDGKYAVTADFIGGLVIAIYPAPNDTDALLMATPKITAWDDENYPSKMNWPVLIAAVLGLGLVTGLIIWVRMRNE